MLLSVLGLFAIMNTLQSAVKKMSKRKNDKHPFGLTIDEVNQHILEGKTNKTETSNVKSIGRILSDNIFTFFNMLLAILAILMLSIRSYENMFFVIIATANMLIGIFQELKARKIIMRLSLINESDVKVIRQGIHVKIPVDELVLSDVYYLEAGRQIIADGKIITGNLTVNEANITGESEPVSKEEGDKILSGSFVVSGDAYARSTAVGDDNYVEQLSAKVKNIGKPKSVILKSLNQLLRVIAIIIIPLGILTFYNAFESSGMDYLLDFINTPDQYQNALKKMAGSMVAMVPSGLFLLTTLAFANSVIRLSKHNTLVQELYSIETLARVDTVCLDKTGTITDGTMDVEKVVTPEYQSHDFSKTHEDYNVNKIIASMNHELNDNNQTALALQTYFGRKQYYEEKQIVPFRSDKKYSICEFDHGIFALGAPETAFYGHYTQIKPQVEAYASDGKRVLALVRTERIRNDKVSGKKEIIALIIMSDNIRDNATETLDAFNASGVELKVISGDNAVTVSEVAKRAGVNHAEKAISLEDVKDKDLPKIALEHTIFGRVRPEQKRIIIDTLKKNNHKVAMIGDGVNDILALKHADCSVAIAGGAEAARNISHLVLLDNDFSSIPKVIKQGRQIVSNMERASVLYLVKTVYTVLLTIILLMTSRIYPFEPVHMFVIETFIIGIPSFFIALEPSNRKFKGNFLINVFKRVIPGALLVIMNLLGVYIFAGFWANITEDEISTVGILAATFAYFLVLVNVCTPMNWFKSAIVIFAGISSFMAFMLFNDLFKLTPLSMPSFLLLLLLFETTYILVSMFKGRLIKFWP